MRIVQRRRRPRSSSTATAISPSRVLRA
jgi:hypothetical protein